MSLAANAEAVHFGVEVPGFLTLEDWAKIDAGTDDSIFMGFGAGSVDYFPELGDVDPNSNPGSKTAPWSLEKEARLEALKAQGVESHPGGNILNWLAYFARIAKRRTVFVGLLGGEDEPTSKKITGHLRHLGIIDLAVRAPGVVPSASIVEHALLPDGRPDDREVHGRPRKGRLSEHLDRDHIRRVLQLGSTAATHVVGIASPKDTRATQMILDEVPEDYIVYYNAGGSEFDQHPGFIQSALRRADVFSLNDEEIRKLWGVPHGTPIEPLVRRTSRLVRGITVCTMGLDGVMITRGGEVPHHQPAEEVPAKLVKSTLGTGDRAGAIATDKFIEGASVETIAQAIVRGTGPVVRTLGAHSDLYE